MNILFELDLWYLYLIASVILVEVGGGKGQFLLLWKANLFPRLRRSHNRNCFSNCGQAIQFQWYITFEWVLLFVMDAHAAVLRKIERAEPSHKIRLRWRRRFEYTFNCSFGFRPTKRPSIGNCLNYFNEFSAWDFLTL